MTVAIVGANGFVGTRLVEVFHLGGSHIVVPVVRRPSALALSARFELEGRVADALDVSSLSAALTGCDAVIHVALGDPRQIEAMPAVLCAAAAAANIERVIYLSSAAVHGPAPSAGTNEDSDLHTHHTMDYNNAKVRAERAFFRATARHRLVGFALRPGVVFGPRSRWITDLAADLRQRRAWLLGDGVGRCNTLYVDNLVEAISRCLVALPSTAGAYLVGDAEHVTWADLYHRVARSLGVAASSIHHDAVPPVFVRTPAERLSRILSSPLVQATLPLIPSRLKQCGKRVAAALTAPAHGPDAWCLPTAPGPHITQELALLQQNAWPLPSARAEQFLGYRAPVSFPSGLARSLAWLAFAEGRS